MCPKTKIRLFLLLPILALISHSCVIQKNIKYLQPREGLESEKFPINPSATEYKIQKGDILSIQVNSTVATNIDIIDGKFKSDKGAAGDELFGYNIDNEGNVTLPILGNIKIEGLTLKQASDTILTMLEEYVKYVTVTVKMKGLRYTVLGEVTRPGERVTPYSRVNLFEAIAQSGDFTYHSNRKNVKLIRRENNVNQVFVLDFTSKDLLLSDKFFIQPNDILIVDARNSKLFNENVKSISLYASILSLSLLLYFRFQNLR